MVGTNFASPENLSMDNKFLDKHSSFSPNFFLTLG